MSSVRRTLRGGERAQSQLHHIQLVSISRVDLVFASFLFFLPFLRFTWMVSFYLIAGLLSPQSYPVQRFRGVQ